MQEVGTLFRFTATYGLTSRLTADTNVCLLTTKDTYPGDYQGDGPSGMETFVRWPQKISLRRR